MQFLENHKTSFPRLGVQRQFKASPSLRLPRRLLGGGRGAATARPSPELCLLLPSELALHCHRLPYPSSCLVSTQTHLAQILNQAGKVLDSRRCKGKSTFSILLGEAESLTVPDWPGTLTVAHAHSLQLPTTGIPGGPGGGGATTFT